MALALVMSALFVGSAGSTQINGTGHSVAQDSTSASTSSTCKSCKKAKKKAAQCKKAGDDSASCKKAIKKARKCKKILKSDECKKPADDGGDGGGPACAAYTPGEQGAEAETTVVTDAATEEAPIEITVTTAEAAGGEPADTATVYHNIQVDPAAADTGLYARFEFATGEDYDITLYYPDGSTAASAGGYNPAPEGPLDGTGSGGHSEMTAEQLDGIESPDCEGYTLGMASFQTPGGDKTLKLWLGEATYTPGQ